MDWIKNFAETAISYISVAEQNYMRWHVAKKTGIYIETLTKHGNQLSEKQKRLSYKLQKSYIRMSRQ
jgi:hypothetical protein